MKFDKDKLKALLAESDVKTTEDLQVFMRGTSESRRYEQLYRMCSSTINILC